MLDSDPTVISMRCLLADPGAVFPWHSHAFDEFTLVTDDDTVIGYPQGKRPTRRNTLLLYHCGEQHGSWSNSRQKPLSGSCTLPLTQVLS